MLGKNVLFYISIIFFLNVFKEITASQVISVNDTTYEEYINNNEFVSIYFHATWSNDSKNIRMQYMSLPHSVKSDSKIAFLETTNKSYLINYKYDIKNYPTILLINKDNHFTYKGSMKTRDIAEWFENKISKKINEIKDSKEIEKIFEKSEVLIIYLGKDPENSTNDTDILSGKSSKYFYDEFVKVTENLGDLNFYKITNSTVIQDLNINPEYKNLSPKVLILKTFDDNLNIFPLSNKNLESEFNTYNIENFVRGFSLPAINPFSSNNHIYVVNNKKEFTILVVNSNKTIDFDEDIYAPDGLQIYKDFYAEAMKYRGKLFFMLANYTDLSQTTLLQDFEVNENDLPIIILNGFNKERTKFERFKSTVNDLENLKEFYERYKYKALPRYFKSDPLPANKFAYENVYRLVRKNFNELVIDSNTSFLVFLVRRNLIFYFSEKYIILII